MTGPWKTAHDSAIEGLAMIWEAVEALGPAGALPSEEALLNLYGPEPHHRAQAIVNALTGILGDAAQQPTRPA